MNKKTKIKLVIFDAYGVVLTGGYPVTCEYLAQKYKLDFKNVYDVLYKKYFNDASERKITQQAAWQLGLNDLKIPLKASEAKKIHYNLMGLNKDILRFKETAEKNNIKVLLLSKNTRSQFYEINKKLGFRKYFKYVINTWELNLPKASKETLKYIMEKFKVRRDEILIIDDQEENLFAAREMGVKTIFYKNFSQFKEEIDNYIK